MALTLTAQQVKEAIVKLFTLLSQGMSEKDAMEAMGLAVEDFQSLHARMFDSKADEVRTRPTEHVYVQYMIDQSRNIKDLTDMVGMFKFTKQYNAMVGAVRARAEIVDKLITTGQQFGLIEKKAEEKVIRAGVMIHQLTNKELQKMITGELSSLNTLISQFGEQDILDIEPGPSHYDAPATAKTTLVFPATAAAVPATKNKTARANSHKVHGGRRVVKQKMVVTHGGDTVGRKD